MNRVYFKEEQKFQQGWMWFVVLLLPLGMIILFGTGLFQQLHQGKPFGNNPLPNESLIILSLTTIAFSMGVFLLFTFTRMETKVVSRGIKIKYPPFISKEKLIPKEEIVSYKLRKYRSIKEYGGHGFKKRGKSGIAYSVSGNMGIQLLLKNNKKLLIGTQRPQPLAAAMKKMMEND